jgi:threonine synthase
MQASHQPHDQNDPSPHNATPTFTPGEAEWLSGLSHLECARCVTRYDASEPRNLCSCGTPLLVRYDLDVVRASVSTADIAPRPPDLWRYRELLPVLDRRNVVTLGEGMTPILPLPAYGERIGLPGLLVKDEGLLPTGSFKARGAAVGVSKARELGIDRITMPTNGNAGAAWAAYAARAGMRSLVVMPQDAPPITRLESAMAGARLYIVDGLIGDAGAIAAQAVDDGWFNTSTLREPYRIEGKKTMGLELVEQLGWRVPDVIVYPTGGGVGLIGIRKALDELHALGWLTGGLPRLVAVQAAGCAPIVRAFEEGAETARPWEDADTLAFGINVPSALGDFLMLAAIRDTGGTAIAVSDEEIVSAQARCAATEGLFMCPEGAATLAAVERLRHNDWITADDEVLVLNTGSGLKYPHTTAPPDPPLLPKDGTLPGGVLA